MNDDVDSINDLDNIDSINDLDFSDIQELIRRNNLKDGKFSNENRVYRKKSGRKRRSHILNELDYYNIFMKNKVEVGMVFKNFRELCEYIGVEYPTSDNSKSVLIKRMNKFFKFEEIEAGKRKIVVKDCYYEDNKLGVIDENRGVYNDELNLIFIDLMIDGWEMIERKLRDERDESVNRNVNENVLEAWDGIIRKNGNKKFLGFDRVSEINSERKILQYLGIWRELEKGVSVDEVYRKVIQNYKYIAMKICRGSLNLLMMDEDSEELRLRGIKKEDFGGLDVRCELELDKEIVKTRRGGVKVREGVERVYKVKKDMDGKNVGDKGKSKGKVNGKVNEKVNGKVVAYKQGCKSLEEAYESIVEAWWDRCLEWLVETPESVLHEITGGVSGEEYKRYWDLVREGKFVGRVKW